MKNYAFDEHKLIYHIHRLNTFLNEGDCYPLYMEISPVGNCNHKCIFCAYDYIGHPNKRLETNRLIKFIDEIAACGMKSLLYAGEGEPLLHPDIDKFITHSKKNGIDPGVFTNGHLLKEKLSEEILPLLTFIRISFNGGTRENYARIHDVKPEVFDVVVKNIETASNLKERDKLEVDIGIQYVLLPENINHVIDAVKRLRETGINYFVIKPFVQQSHLQAYQMKGQFNLSAIQETLDQAENLSSGSFQVIARKASFENYGKRNYSRCHGTAFISVLNSSGEVATCLPYWDKKEFVFGNIYENTFQEIWPREKREKIKEYLENKLDVTSCPPNCRPNAINKFLYELKHPSVMHINFI